MTFDELLGQVKELLQRQQRVSYRGVKRRFDLDDEYLEDLKEELIGAMHLATDEDGRYLAWAGDGESPQPQAAIPQPSQPLNVYQVIDTGPLRTHLHLAGQQAVQRSANEEAIRDFASALELLTALPNTTDRARQELALQLALETLLAATKGWSVPEVEWVYARARALCEQVSEPSQLMQVLNQLSSVTVTRAGYATVRELVEQLVSVAKTKHGEPYLAEALVLQGVTALWHGEFMSARDLGELCASFTKSDLQQFRMSILRSRVS